MYWTCLVEAALFMAISPTRLLQCTTPTVLIGGYQLASIGAIFGLRDRFYFYEFWQLTQLFWLVIVMLSLIMTEYLNSVLIVDLYLSITNPFVPRESRLKYYYIVPVLTFITYSVLIYLYGLGVITNKYSFTGHQGNAIYQFTYWQPIVVELVTFVCGFMVIYLLCQERTSPQLKQLVLKRHMLYFVFYILYMIDQNLK